MQPYPEIDLGIVHHFCAFAVAYGNIGIGTAHYNIRAAEAKKLCKLIGYYQIYGVFAGAALYANGTGGLPDL